MGVERYTASEMEADMHGGISGCLAPLVQLPRPPTKRPPSPNPAFFFFFVCLSVEISSLAICPCKFFEQHSLLEVKNCFFRQKYKRKSERKCGVAGI